jgi:hypothetical protein
LINSRGDLLYGCEVESEGGLPLMGTGASHESVVLIPYNEVALLEEDQAVRVAVEEDVEAVGKGEFLAPWLGEVHCV